MWSLEGQAVINTLAVELARQGKPERDALVLATDQRKQAERDKVLAEAKARKTAA